MRKDKGKVRGGSRPVHHISGMPRTPVSLREIGMSVGGVSGLTCAAPRRPDWGRTANSLGLRRGNLLREFIES